MAMQPAVEPVLKREEKTITSGAKKRGKTRANQEPKKERKAAKKEKKH